MSEKRTEVVGGVDTHRDVHVAAAVDAAGALLGTASFPADAAGYGELAAWLASWGRPRCVGVEGTGSYGAGLARHLAAAGVRVVEVNRPNRQERR
ncbi:MAG: transposase, partial [bacterium]|nr:transposase [bacterium]